MSTKGICATIIWTEIIEALRKDNPKLLIPVKAGMNTSKVINNIAEMVVDEKHETSKSV